MKITINADIFAALCYAVSDDAARPHLGGVFFQVENGKEFAVASNGCIISFCKLPNGSIEGVSENEIIIKVSTKLWTAAKNKKASRVVISDDFTRVMSLGRKEKNKRENVENCIFMEETKIVNFDFPPWRRVILTDVEFGCKALLGQDVMRKVCDTAKYLGSNSFSIFGCFNSSINMIKYDQQPNFYTGVMPMRAPGDDTQKLDLDWL